MKRCFVYAVIALLGWMMASCKATVAPFPISEPSASVMDVRLTGKWKIKEDTDKNNFYIVEQADEEHPNRYHVQYWDRGGTNVSHEANIHLSKVGNSLFINVPYPGKKGYMLLKVIFENADVSKIITAAVSDKTMASLASDAEVHDHIAERIKDPFFYSDTLQFIKVK